MMRTALCLLALLALGGPPASGQEAPSGAEVARILKAWAGVQTEANLAVEFGGGAAFTVRSVETLRRQGWPDKKILKAVQEGGPRALGNLRRDTAGSCPENEGNVLNYGDRSPEARRGQVYAMCLMQSMDAYFKDNGLALTFMAGGAPLAKDVGAGLLAKDDPAYEGTLRLLGGFDFRLREYRRQFGGVPVADACAYLNSTRPSGAEALLCDGGRTCAEKCKALDCKTEWWTQQCQEACAKGAAPVCGGKSCPEKCKDLGCAAREAAACADQCELGHDGMSCGAACADRCQGKGCPGDGECLRACEAGEPAACGAGPCPGGRCSREAECAARCRTQGCVNDGDIKGCEEVCKEGNPSHTYRCVGDSEVEFSGARHGAMAEVYEELDRSTEPAACRDALKACLYRFPLDCRGERAAFEASVGDPCGPRERACRAGCADAEKPCAEPCDAIGRAAASAYAACAAAKCQEGAGTSTRPDCAATSCRRESEAAVAGSAAGRECVQRCLTEMVGCQDGCGKAAGKCRAPYEARAEQVQNACVMWGGMSRKRCDRLHEECLAPFRAEEARRAAEAAKPAPAPPPSAAAGLEAAARRTLRELSEAYAQKRRSAFMRLVSDDYRGDAAALEDALLKDFRDYRAVNLDAIVDGAAVDGDIATLSFHYNLTVVDSRGADRSFAGTASFVFRREGEAVRLMQMSAPLLFGNSLPSAQNPVPTGQGSASSGGTAPGGGSGGGAPSNPTPPAQGAAFIQGVGGNDGYNFKTQSNTPGPAGSDVYAVGAGGACAASPCFSTAPPGTGSVQSIGACDLQTLTGVPASVNGTTAAANVGECYALRTGDGHYAAARVLATNPALQLINFEWVYQSDGTNRFR